jgi:hypothetical protein
VCVHASSLNQTSGSEKSGSVSNVSICLCPVWPRVDAQHFDTVRFSRAHMRVLLAVLLGTARVLHAQLWVVNGEVHSCETTKSVEASDGVGHRVCRPRVYWETPVPAMKGVNQQRQIVNKPTNKQTKEPTTKSHASIGSALITRL